MTHRTCRKCSAVLKSGEYVYCTTCATIMAFGTPKKDEKKEK